MESDSYKADKLADQNVATRNYSKNRLIETEDEAEERERRVALMNKGLEPLIAIPEGSLFRKIIDNIHIPFGCLTVGYAVVLNNGLKNRKDVSTFYRRGLMIQLGLVSAGMFLVVLWTI